MVTEIKASKGGSAQNRSFEYTDSDMENNHCVLHETDKISGEKSIDENLLAVENLLADEKGANDTGPSTNVDMNVARYRECTESSYVDVEKKISCYNQRNKSTEQQKEVQGR